MYSPSIYATLVAVSVISQFRVITWLDVSHSSGSAVLNDDQRNIRTACKLSRSPACHGIWRWQYMQHSTRDNLKNVPKHGRRLQLNAVTNTGPCSDITRQIISHHVLERFFQFRRRFCCWRSTTRTEGLLNSIFSFIWTNTADSYHVVTGYQTTS